MTPATWPREDPLATRLLEIGPDPGGLSEHDVSALPQLLQRGDVVVLNDAATLPGSLPGMTSRGEAMELRLAGPLEGNAALAVVFGAGDWRLRTEDRRAPPQLRVGDRLLLDGLGAQVIEVDAASPRLVRVAFDTDGDALWRALYHAGRPVQYAYLRAALELWHVQTTYAARPWAAEPPSAGLALTWGLLLALRARGVRVARLTHAAGLSSTGDAALDARLPFAERYAIPAETVELIAASRREGRRVIAIGTTVTRALEGVAAAHGELVSGDGTTAFRLDAGTPLRVVDGILTGIHEPGGSHFRLLEAFAPRARLEAAYAESAARGHLEHEFGDAWLAWASR